jgi:ribosome biogenesis GTPase A
MARSSRNCTCSYGDNRSIPEIHSSPRYAYTCSATTAPYSEDSRVFGPVAQERIDRASPRRRVAAWIDRRPVKDRLDNVVQWYPGHMVRAMRRIAEYLKLIDIVIEVIDARVPCAAMPIPCSTGSSATAPASSRSPRRSRGSGHDQSMDRTAHLARTRGDGGRRRVRSRVSSRILAALTAKAKLRSGISRVIVVGVPNSGNRRSSTACLRRGAAKTEDRAGVTRQLQWFRLAPTIELMDTPGILVPKIASAQAQWKLALIGAVPRERYDPYEVALNFTAGSTSAAADAQRFPTSRASRRRAASHDAAAKSTSTMPHKPTSRPSMTDVFGRISLEAPGDVCP